MPIHCDIFQHDGYTVCRIDHDQIGRILSICPSCGALVRGQVCAHYWDKFIDEANAIFACPCGAHWAASEGCDG